MSDRARRAARVRPAFRARREAESIARTRDRAVARGLHSGRGMRLLAILSLLLVAGCSSPATPPPVGLDGGPPPDARVVPDAARAPGSGGPCETDADCPLGTCQPESLRGWTDGFCLVECFEDADCPSDTHCFSAPGVCAPDCARDADCRSGFLCYDQDEDGRPECAPAGTGSGPIGAACSAVDECAGGTFAFCFRRGDGSLGRCMDRCASDAECGPGAHCDEAGTRMLCFPDCASDADCLEGDVCALVTVNPVSGTPDPRPECTPRFNSSGLGTGERCALADECAARGNAICILERFTSIGFCTEECGPGVPCDPGAHCASLEAASGAHVVDGCVRDCEVDADCPTGTGCVDNDRDGRRECFPAGTGTLGVGERCASTSECAGGALGMCLHVRPDLAFCVLDCRREECPMGSVCVTRGGGVSCYPACTTDADCPSSLVCRDSPMGMACQP